MPPILARTAAVSKRNAERPGWVALFVPILHSPADQIPRSFRLLIALYSPLQKAQQNPQSPLLNQPAKFYTENPNLEAPLHIRSDTSFRTAIPGIDRKCSPTELPAEPANRQVQPARAPDIYRILSRQPVRPHRPFGPLPPPIGHLPEASSLTLCKTQAHTPAG